MMIHLGLLWCRYIHLGFKTRKWTLSVVHHLVLWESTHWFWNIWLETFILGLFWVFRIPRSVTPFQFNVHLVKIFHSKLKSALSFSLHHGFSFHMELPLFQLDHFLPRWIFELLLLLRLWQILLLKIKSRKPKSLEFSLVMLEIFIKIFSIWRERSISTPCLGYSNRRSNTAIFISSCLLWEIPAF